MSDTGRKIFHPIIEKRMNAVHSLQYIFNTGISRLDQHRNMVMGWDKYANRDCDYSHKSSVANFILIHMRLPVRTRFLKLVQNLEARAVFEN